MPTAAAKIPPRRLARITTLIDAEGELHAVQQQRDPKRSFARVFTVTFDDAAEKVATKVTSAATLRLLLVLPRLLSHTQWRRLDQIALARRLNVAQGSVSRSLAELVTLDVIERRGKGPVVEWRLSPDYSWRGTVDSYHEAQRQRGERKRNKPPEQPPSAAEDIVRKTPQRNLRLLTAIQ